MIKKKIVAILGLLSLVFVYTNTMAADHQSPYTKDDWTKARIICDSHVASLAMQNASASTQTTISFQFDANDVVGEQCMKVYSHFIYESENDKLNQIKFLNDITNQKGKN